MNRKLAPLTVRGVVFSALFGALMVATSFIKLEIGISPVHITLENMTVMLTGAILGARYGFFSIGTVVLLTALGLPLLHGNGGPGLLLGPTGGFIWMFPFSALLVGWFGHRIRGHGWTAFASLFAVIVVFGVLLVYVTGVPWLAYKMQISFGKALALGFYPFIGGDIVKAVIATFVALQVRRVFGKFDG